MKKGKEKEIQRQKRHKRIKKTLMRGNKRLRLVVRRSLKNIYAQVVDDENGRSLLTLSTLTKEVREDTKVKTKTERSRVVGLLLAKKCIELKIEKVVFDRGGYKYHGRVKALAEGAREGGLKF
jgi:large subunit ribosomal protein L18